MRGPNYGGSCLFDENCIFANNMELKKDKCKYLNDLCKDAPWEPIKYYVYKMSASSVLEKKCKMEFGIQFTKSSLRKYIKEGPIMVLVEHVNSRKTFRVKLKLVLGTKKAMLSGGWEKATARYRMDEGELYIFSLIYPSELHGLTLELIPL